MFDNDVYIAELLYDLQNEIVHEGRSKRDGAPVGSGRYPLGSGETPFQHEPWFEWVQLRKQFKAQGMSDNEVAKAMGISIKEYRAMVTITKEQSEAALYTYVKKLRTERQMSVNAIAKQLGVSEGTIRGINTRWEEGRKQLVTETSKTLVECLKDSPYIDVGKGTSTFMNISQQTLDAAFVKLKGEGYIVVPVKISQLGTANGQTTTLSILCKEGTTVQEIQNHLGEIMPVTAHFEDAGDGKKVAKHWEYPQSIDSSRVLIRYAEDGGITKDGTIELRRGVPDLDLGRDVHYAQVRIGVDDSHYLKGMALYSDNVPPGYDVVFNTNKTKDVPMLGPDKDHSVLKPYKDDPDNPFGSALRMTEAQYHYTDENGETKLGAINKVRQEGDWDTWSKSLASQILSKQSTELAKHQLKIKYDDLKGEYDQIMGLTNPIVKRHLLAEFAEKCDAASVELKAAAMPRQATRVLLPIDDLGNDEIYAPGYRNGEQVCLFRFPHAGTFEIAQLTVNNKNPAAKSILGQATDAVGINSSVAGRLSGADFDGDTGLVIPTDGKNIQTSPALKGLINFEPKIDYAAYDKMPRVGKEDSFNTQRQMGSITNLIADMQLKGAPLNDVCLAVKHSMVVIDAEKHNLNWKQSEEDCDIKRLRMEYQGKSTGGSSTLITRAKSEEHVLQRQLWQPSKSSIDPETGEKIYRNTEDAVYIDKKTGKEKTKTTKSTKMAEALRDGRGAEALYSDPDNPKKMEVVYAKFANDCHALGNKARKSWLDTPSTLETTPQAKKNYAPQVESLMGKLREALINSPKERQAQAIANAQYRAKLKEDPVFAADKDAKKKERNRLLTEARKATGAGKKRIYVTDDEWKAIQAGAISANTLTQIFNNSDKDRIKELSMPKSSKRITVAQLNRIRSLKKDGYQISDIADHMGLSVSAINAALAEANSKAG